MIKSAYGTGSITPKGKHRWLLRVDIAPDPVTGARRRPVRTFAGTKTAARRELDRWRAELAEAPAAWQDITTGEWFRRWHDRRIEDELIAPRTIGTESSIITRHLLPSLGTVALSELKRVHIDEFVRSLAGPPKSLSPATVRRAVAVLGGGLEAAVRDELLDRNPAKGI